MIVIKNYVTHCYHITMIVIKSIIYNFTFHKKLGSIHAVHIYLANSKMGYTMCYIYIYYIAFYFISFSPEN